MSQTFDRSQLDGKDREQLTAIASALGLRSLSRMKKAELVDAIVGAAAGGNGAGGGSADAKPRKIRSTRSAGEDDLASLAAEQDALDRASSPSDDMALIRPRRTSGRPNGTAATTVGSGTGTTNGAASASTSARLSDVPRSDGTIAPARGTRAPAATSCVCTCPGTRRGPP